MQEALPPEAYRIVESSVLVPGQDSLSIGLLGLVFLLVAASNFFYSLDRAFDKIWGVAFQPEPGQNPWKILWVLLRKKALLTAGMPLLLQYLVHNSVLSLGDRFRSYGVVGRVMVLMFWIYLTSQIFFLGGELTYVYAQLFGSRRNTDPQPKP